MHILDADSMTPGGAKDDTAIMACPKCGYGLASATWHYRYHSGATRSALLCASCGFDWLARGAVVGAQLGPCSKLPLHDAKGKRKMSLEESTLRQELAALRATLRSFKRVNTA